MSKPKVFAYPAFVAVMCMLLLLVLGACGDTATPATTTSAATTSAATTTTNAATTTTAAMTTTSAATTAAAMTTTSAATTAAAMTTTSAATTAASASGGGVMAPFSFTAPSSIKGGPGVDLNAKTINVGAIGALTGPIAIGGVPLVRGEEVFFKMLNDMGGIGGFKVNITEGDSQYSPQLTVQQYTKMVPNVAIFGQIIGAPAAAAVKDLATGDKVLFLAATSDSSILAYPYGFIDAIPYPLEAINVIDYAANQLGKKNSKFAIIYQNDDYGQDVIKGYKAIIQADNLQDVADIPFNVTDKDFTGQITQAKNAGADVVWLASQPAQTAAIMGTAIQVGYNPQWLLESPAFNTQLLNTPIKDVLMKSYVASYGVVWGDPNAPGEALKLAAVAKYAPDQKPDNYFTAGWWYGIVITNILANALKSGDLSRDGIYKAFQSTKNIDLGNGPGQPLLSYGSTPNDRVPFRSSIISKPDPTVLGGLGPVSQPYTSDAAKNYKFS